jgi:diguanylate cyclase (GGDEF)-like protein/PAS domain S-box-containing protein
MINNEHFYETLFKNNQEIMILINPETCDIVDCNLSACLFYGYPYDEMLKLKITDFNTLTKEQIIKEMNIAKVEHRNTFYFKHRLLDGQVRDVEVKSTPINLEGKDLLFSIISDTTDIKILSDKLKIQNTILEKTVAERTYELEETNLMLGKCNNLSSAIIESSTQIMVFALDCNYRYLSFNTKHKNIMKLICRKKIEIGMNILDVIIENEDKRKAKVNFERALSGESFSLIQEFGTEKRSKVYWQNFWSPILSKEGNILGLVCFSINVTEIKLIEEKNKQNERILRDSQKAAHVGSYVNYLADNTWISSEETDRILGIGENYLRTLNGWVNIIHPDWQKEIFDYNSELYYKKKSFNHEYKIIRVNDGEERWVNDRGEFEFDDRGNIVCMIGTIHDITEHKKIEIARAEEKKLLQTTLISIGDGVISTDNNGNIVLLNKVAEFLTGWTQEEAMCKPIKEVFNTINEITRENSENIVKKVLENGKSQDLSNHTILISRDGIERYIENSSAPIMNENHVISGMVLVFRDVTDKKEKQNEILDLSYRDQLTGIYNRRFFKEELMRLDTGKNLPLTIVMGDVNGLKLINDSFGHDIGDELLKKVAEVIRNGCRDDDVIARLGGDEFVIVLPKTDSMVAEEIIKNIHKLALEQKVGSIDVSISFGYGTKNDSMERISDIIKNAEDHMYKKKLFEGPSMRGKTIRAIISTLHEKNKREEQHSNRVSILCKSMGEVLNLTEQEIHELKTVGLLHDIGKIAIDENILNKPGKLTDDEWNEIKRHPEIGYRILNTVNDMSDMAKYVLYHHESWDGQGYPKGLKGKDIPFMSRVIAITDTYDAMTSERSYRSALPAYVAINELQKNSGIQFDPELVKIFIEKVLGEHPADV